MKSKLCGAEPLCLFPKALFRVLSVITLLSLLIQLPGQAQNGLSIGDKVPDVPLNNVINGRSGARLADFKGKLLIIDFWATWCSPCLFMLPKSDSLQKAFAGKIQILPVTYQSEKDVRKLLSKPTKLKNVSLPFVVSDTALHKLFPHKELPHYVWIDQYGTVKAITDWQEVTGEKINTMLASTTAVLLKEKKDVIVKYDRELPLMLNDLQFSESDMHYETLLTKYKEGLSSRTDVLRYEDGSFSRITITNGSIKHLMAFAFSSPKKYFDRNMILMEMKDPSGITMLNTDNASKEEILDWMRDNTFCYEIMVPHRMSGDIFEIMQQDMKRFFPQCDASVEKRNVRCLVLERTSKVDKIKTSGNPVNFSFDHTEANLTNCSLALLLSQLNGVDLQHLNIPIVDGTGYTEKVDLNLDCNLSNVGSLRQALSRYDLDLVEKIAPMEMLVIRDSH